MKNTILFHPNCQKVMEYRRAFLAFKAIKGDKEARKKITVGELEGLNGDANDFGHFLEDNKEVLAVYENPGVSL